ncbi:MAG TPA: hypothetical protein VK646_08650, partial [Actinomycetota bacterium]|nr:hypothetical protein [Actinomycetota bacterium]
GLAITYRRAAHPRILTNAGWVTVALAPFAAFFLTVQLSAKCPSEDVSGYCFFTASDVFGGWFALAFFLFLFDLYGIAAVLWISAGLARVQGGGAAR